MKQIAKVPGRSVARRLVLEAVLGAATGYLIVKGLIGLARIL